MGVRAGKVLRMGEREVIVCTARGSFSRWHVNRTGGSANTTEADVREEILSALNKEKSLQGKNKDQFQVIDFQVAGYIPSDVPNQDDTVKLQVLTAIVSYGRASYALVTLSIAANGAASVEDVHVIKSYATRFEEKSPPRLYVPSPKKTAFVVFTRAVVVISKLHRDANDMDDDEEEATFEDVVDFRGDLGIEIVGSGQENIEDEVSGSFTIDQGHNKRVKNPGVVLMAKGAGVLRVEAFDIHGTRKAPAPVTIKSKLEQAVFYGTKSDNPLNFKGREEVKFPLEELETAALQLSKDILTSSSQYFPAMLPSLVHHLELRATHLRTLITHLQTGAFGQVSKGVLWQLLQDAEKCEAARAVWEVRNERLSEEDGDGILESVIIDKLMKDTQTADTVRTWFQHHILDIGLLLAHAKVVIASRPNKGKREQLAFAISDAEANDFVIKALEKAWLFRVNNAKLYGLGGKHGVDVNGLLMESRGFVAPWTSELDLLHSLADQFKVSEFALHPLLAPTEDPKRNDIAEKIKNQLVHIAEVCCRSFEERADWATQQGSTYAEEAFNVRERYDEYRSKWIKPLVEYDKMDHAFRIAEDYSDYQTLVEICSEELARVDFALAEAKIPVQPDVETIQDLEELRNETQTRIERYFARFGEPFAKCLYTHLVETGKLHTLVTGYEQWREKYLTEFLRSNRQYAKLSWMHDISLGDYQNAATTLLSVGNAESMLSYQRIELSISKLALVAALQKSGVPEADILEEVEAYDAKLAMVDIQEELTAFIQQNIGGTIDADASVDVAVEEFNARIRGNPTLEAIMRTRLRVLMNKRVLGAEELVEVFTLIESDDTDVMDGETGYWALKCIAQAGLPRSRAEALQRMVWRRVYLADEYDTRTRFS